MEFLGITFLPFRESVNLLPYTLSATSFTVCIFFSGIISSLITLYLIIYTQLRWIIFIYLYWIWFIDKDICEKGGRRSAFIRSWTGWRYMKEYFPSKIVKLPGFELDPKKNYMFCTFPHGVLPIGVCNGFLYEYSEFNEYFPHHIRYMVTLSQQFVFPFSRDLILGMGGISHTPKSIEYVLSRPGGGNICGISVGGAKEALYSKPGTYRLALKHKRGFVKLALRNGTPMVPVLSFGETELYDQVQGLEKVQGFLRKWIVISPCIFFGRGLFQDSFGIVPRKHSITTVVGEPIDVPKIPDPTKEQIDKYHALFVEKLTGLFEQQKFKYVENPDVTKLIID